MAARAVVSFKSDPAGISGLLAKVGQAVYDGVETAATVIQEAAQAICPVDTGFLRDSITVDVHRGIQSATSGGLVSSSLFTVEAIVSPHADYAAYVEFGTGRRGAASPGAGEGPYSEHWPGMVAQPYMRPAYDENREHVADFIKESVQDAIG